MTIEINVNWKYSTDIIWWEDEEIGTFKEEDYINDMADNGYNLLGPPVRLNNVGSNTKWIYYYRKQIIE